jgi:hypothetical protein
MVRVNNKKSPSTRRRALIRQKERNSQRVFEGETGRLKNGPRLGDWVYGTHLSMGFA